MSAPREPLAVVCLMLALVAGCGAPAPVVWSLSGPTMGTTYHVALVASDEAQATRLKTRIDERLAAFGRQMSTYDPESELSRFNASATTDWFAVSADTALVVAASLALAEETSGALDPTVGPLVAAWGFGPEGRRDELPTADELEALRREVGHEKLSARDDPPALRKASPVVRVDLNATAPGYAVDIIARQLDGGGVAAYMVEIGGEVRVKGRKPGGGPWRIGVEALPQEGAEEGAKEKGELGRVLTLDANQSVATSGDYRNYFERDGKRYSHTIDPRTGRPVEHDLATVTVVADTCLLADGAATAIMVLGPQAGYDWAERRGLAALLVRRGPDGTPSVRTTPAWDPQRLESKP